MRTLQRHLFGFVAVGLGAWLCAAGTAQAQVVKIEICDNGIDDDADGLTDENCEICGNSADEGTSGYADEGCNPWGATGVCEQPLSCDRSGYVSPLMGGLTWKEKPDFAPIMAYGPAMTFQRIYHTKYFPTTSMGGSVDYRFPFGYGWTHNWMSWVWANGYYAIVRLPTGEEVAFSSSDGINFTPQVGRHYKSLVYASYPTNTFTLTTLTGDRYVFADNAVSTIWKLTQVQDAFASPNSVAITYWTGGNIYDGQVKRVTSANGQQWYDFGYESTGNGRLTSVTHNWNNGATAQAVTFAYNATYANNLYTATLAGGSGNETERYTVDSSNRLTAVTAMSGGTTVAAFSYDATNRVATIDGVEGGMAFTYATTSSPADGCDGSNGTKIYYNRINGSSCTQANASSVCGASNYCSAPSSGSGYCYAAWRCESVKPSVVEDLVTDVSSSCTSCVRNKHYEWDTNSKIEFIGTKSADNIYTTLARDSNGMVTTRLENDSDGDYSVSTAPSGSRATWLFYGNSSFPGRVTEVRRKSELSASACDGSSNTTGCKRTLTTWNTNGLLVTKEETGYTYGANANTEAYDYTTAWNYSGTTAWQLASIDSPLTTGATSFTYWGSGSGNATDYVKDTTRKVNGTSGTELTSTNQDYNGDGRPVAVSDPNSRWRCTTYATQFPDRPILKRVKGDSATNCNSGSSDEDTNYVYDDYGRLQKLTRPVGDFLYYIYDTSNRPSEIRECSAGSSSTCSSDTNRYSMKYYYRPDFTSGAGWEEMVSRVEWLSGTTVKRSQNYVYGADRRLATMPNPMLSVAKTIDSYDDDGVAASLVAQDQSAATMGKTEYDVDAINRLTNLRRFTGTSTSDQWALTPGVNVDLPSQITAPNSLTTTLKWDDLGRKVKQTTPNATASNFVYDGDGNMTIKVNGTTNQKVTCYSYDYQDRLTAMDTDTTTACPTIYQAKFKYSYDALPSGTTCPTSSNCSFGGGGDSACGLLKGHLAWKKETIFGSSYTLQTFYGYTSAGRIAEHTTKDAETSPRCNRFVYTYDKNGNVTNLQYPAGSTSAAVYTYYGTSQEPTPNRIKTLGKSTTNLITNTSWFPMGGPFVSYQQANGFTHTSTFYPIIVSASYNAASRSTQITNQTTFSTPDKITSIDYSEDDKGRYLKRDLTTLESTEDDLFFNYDWQDRLTCQTTTSQTCSSTCSTSPSGTYYDHVTYNSAGDRACENIAHPAVSATYTYNYTGGTNKISSITATGHTISMTWDGRGNRLTDDDSAYPAGVDDDKRVYTYDGRNNLATLTNQIQEYTRVWTYGYDDQGRLVYRARLFQGFVDTWWYFYDQFGRRVQTKFYGGGGWAVYEHYWLGNRNVYTHMSANGGGLGRYFEHSDETGRSYKATYWPPTGDTNVSWAVKQGAFGWDYSGVFQPTGGATASLRGMIESVETAAYNNVTLVRGHLLFGAGRAYDTFTGSYLQEDPNAATRADTPYGLEGWNPVGGAGVGGAGSGMGAVASLLGAPGAATGVANGYGGGIGTVLQSYLEATSRPVAGTMGRDSTEGIPVPSGPRIVSAPPQGFKVDDPYICSVCADTGYSCSAEELQGAAACYVECTPHLGGLYYTCRCSSVGSCVSRYFKYFGWINDGKM